GNWLTFSYPNTIAYFAVWAHEDAEADQHDDTALLSIDSAYVWNGNAYIPFIDLGSPRTATLTIHDVPPPTVEFTHANYHVHEGGGDFAAIGVYVSKPLDHVASVHYATADGTAGSPEDYGATEGTLTLAPGASYYAFWVPIHNDGLDDGDETVHLTLDSP